MDSADYTQQDLARMRYMLPELEAKLKECPNSFPLRNGIARIRQVLGLSQTATPIDPISFIDMRMIAQKMLTKTDVSINEAEIKRIGDEHNAG